MIYFQILINVNVYTIITFYYLFIFSYMFNNMFFNMFCYFIFKINVIFILFYFIISTAILCYIIGYLYQNSCTK